MSKRADEPDDLIEAARSRAYRRLRAEPLAAVQHIAGEIGPRPPTSLGEAKAAAYLDGRLRRAGALVAADSFRTTPPAPWDGLLAALLAAVGFGLYPQQPLPSLLLVLWVAILSLVLLARRGAPIIDRRRTSQNVVATVAAAQGAQRRVVMLAPLDTLPTLGRLGWLLLRGQRTRRGRAIAAVLLALLAIAGLVAPATKPLIWLAQIGPGLYLALLAALELRALRAPFSPGAVSHAGSLAAMLAAVEEAGEPARVELWAVALGVNATGAGLADFLRRYPFDQARTLFVVLHGVGGGELCSMAVGAGVAEPFFATAAADGAAAPDVRLRQRLPRELPNMADVVLAQGFLAVLVAGLDAGGHVPWQASAGDTPERVAGGDVERAARFVANLVRRLDAPTA
jgi:hypothetical protein